MSKIFGLTFFLCFFLSAQDNSIKAQGFKKAEYNDDGKLNCIISGKHGATFGKEARIEGVQVPIYNQSSPLELTTPKCIYNMAKKTCTSKEAVKIKGDGVTITGVGFDINNKTKKIFIRSQVKVIWKKSKLKAETKKDSKEAIK